MHHHLRVLMALCCSRAVSDYQMQLADDDEVAAAARQFAGVISWMYLGVIWARYTTHGHYYAYIKHMITRSQIARYLCTCWTNTYAPDEEFLAREMHLRFIFLDGMGSFWGE